MHFKISTIVLAVLLVISMYFNFKPTEIWIAKPVWVLNDSMTGEVKKYELITQQKKLKFDSKTDLFLHAFKNAKIYHGCYRDSIIIFK